MKPPVLVALVPERPLILYVVAQECSVGILLAQKNDEGKENALYYWNRTMTPNELKYSPIEKLCLTLIFSINKLKHYFQSHSIHLVSKANPLKYVMAKPVLSDRLARGTSNCNNLKSLCLCMASMLLQDSLLDLARVAWSEDDEIFCLKSIKITLKHKKNEDKQVDGGENNPPHALVPSVVVKCNSQVAVAEASKGEESLNTFFVKVGAYDEARSLSSEKLSRSLHEQQLKEVKAHLQDVQAKASEKVSEVQSTMDELEHIEKEIVALKGRRTSLCTTLKGKKQLSHDAQAKAHEVEEDIVALENTAPLDGVIVESLKSSRASLEILKEDLKSLNPFA
ncbi:UNVERIFIED_CONTAM: hypothetical protein Scaly_3141300 [Sesamum calycinum]|uniref:Reverse transcriptase RNase H-like domain-containing protein n=1 Tax=Sesamum calycinum TaxID=2727403 RepID=A0AAW2JHR4_9LAMI